MPKTTARFFLRDKYCISKLSNLNTRSAIIRFIVIGLDPFLANSLSLDSLTILSKNDQTNSGHFETDKL